jgi:putative transposase
LIDESLLANKIHEIWLEDAAGGYRKITKTLQREGYEINHKRVLRMMREMRIQAMYPRPKTSISNIQHKKYPYLLRGLKITRINQVWATDITYIKIVGGYI